jgi:hypothetical protein
MAGRYSARAIARWACLGVTTAGCGRCAGSYQVSGTSIAFDATGLSLTVLEAVYLR